MATIILVAKKPIRLSDIGPAGSSPVILASTFKLTIPNRLRKMTVKAHFFTLLGGDNSIYIFPPSYKKLTQHFLKPSYALKRQVKTYQKVLPTF